MNAAASLGVSVLLLLAGSLASLVSSRHRRASGWLSVLFVAAATGVLWSLVVTTFSQGPEAEVRLLAIPELGATLAVSVSYLSALFLAIVASIAFLTTLFSVEYLDHYRRERVAKYYPVLLVFFVAIIGVVTTVDFLFFLVFWELMTLASFFLVVFEGESAVSQRAGLKYFVVNHAGTFGMMAGALVLWTQSHSFHFSALRDAMGGLLATQPIVGHVVIFLFFMAFATKAGILPMGSWLPDAYPAAPSSASAAFGGSMSKLGIYGLLCVFLYLVPLSQATEIWGIVIALAGASSMLVGTLTALRQDDAKRLMAFHVIGQMGYMFLAIGIGLFFLRSNPALGMLGLLAGVFHMVNNSIYKSCLFLGAGSILYRTGTRSLSALGGLGSVMPVTAACAVGAALAIAGVPPLNGFSSKWLLYVTSIVGGQEVPLFLLLAIAALFISLVTLASFLKYLGGAFLGPRSQAEARREVPWSMLLPQVLLALTCVVFGLVPLWPLAYIHQALAGLIPDSRLPDLASLLASNTPEPGLSVNVLGMAFWSPPLLVVGLAIVAVLAYGIQRAGAAKVRSVPVWTCGEPHQPSIVRYRASSYYLPFKQVFSRIYPSFKPPTLRFPKRVRGALEIDAWCYGPVVRLVERTAIVLSKTHTGTPQMYLLWIAVGATLVVGVISWVLT